MSKLEDILARLAHFFDLDPFNYLIVAIVGIMTWIYFTVVGDFALSGPAVWLRRATLVIAAIGAVLFFYTAQSFP